MYLEFFNLREPPFNVTPDPRFLYFSDQHRDAFDSLIYGIQSRKGFIMLTGEVGCGKTTICRSVLTSLPQTVHTALVLNPSLSEAQLIRAILSDLGLTPCGTDILALIEQLNQFLLQTLARDENVTIIIDESQDLAADVMEHIRLLSNLETDQHKLMQIVLAGQPELKQRVGRPEWRQLRQRIMLHCELHPLSNRDVHNYIKHRLAVAGAPPDVFFDEAAVALIFKRSKGIPRLINRLCDQAMLAAYVGRIRTIGRDHAKRAYREMKHLM